MNFLVVGDVMLDRFMEGTPHAFCSDTGGSYFHVKRATEVPGGAANVAIWLSHYVQQDGKFPYVRLIGVVGDDWAGDTVCKQLASSKVYARLTILKGRPTTVKQRQVARQGAVLRPCSRIDFETTTPVELSETPGIDFVPPDGGSWDAVVFSDYRKGVITKELLQLYRRQQGSEVIVVDPGREMPWSWYREKLGDSSPQCLIKANLDEAGDTYRCIRGSHHSSDPLSLTDLATFLSKVYSPWMIAVTAGAAGIAVAVNGRAESVTAEVKFDFSSSSPCTYPACGAGDVAAAVFAAKLREVGLFDAAFLANQVVAACISQSIRRKKPGNLVSWML